MGACSRLMEAGVTGNLTTLEIAVKLAPRNRAAFRTLAHVRSAQGKTTEAAFALQQARLCQFLDKAEEDRRLVIERAYGKVVKVISALLPSLPLKHRYKIIFMTRPVEDSDFEGGGQSEETFRIDQEAATLEHKPVMELQVFEGMDGGTAWCASGKGLFETRVA